MKEKTFRRQQKRWQMARPRDKYNGCSYCHIWFKTEEATQKHWDSCPVRMRMGVIPHEHQWRYFKRCKCCHKEARIGQVGAATRSPSA